MIRFLLTVLLLAGSITGCSLFSEDEKDNSAAKNKSEEKIVESNSQNENDSKSAKKEPIVDSESAEEGLMVYRPKMGVKKTFIDHENVESLTEEVVFENGDYIQSIVTIGQSPSVMIYKWNKDEISIIETIKNPDNPNNNYLDGFKEVNKQEIMISLADSLKADWKVISQNETVQTPYQTFSNVYVIQKTTNEVEGAETIYTNYFAPGIGLIKESFELTGDQGYKAESLLQKIEEL
ncbi:hypothetical protein F4694_000338 [Bacillus niacini]|jgi:hypothetical protein|uniref:Uncharacterized protein n=1 Tax=Neobacillus niacini TaxID=86668 RepID=A0A852T719_9BACI|nr:hypothetical protein [Neobacillus niacini]NYE03619.1 hypothetical protein [Neobacillus niacini]